MIRFPLQMSPQYRCALDHVLKHGFHLCDRHYKLVAARPMETTLYFFVEKGPGLQAMTVQQFWQSEIPLNTKNLGQVYCKFASRLELLFSGTIASTQVESCECSLIEDDDRHKV